jgi:nucleotide-binding universal stress UspA family protein/RimJ/RimL family protein N-acetyltransferase
MRAGHLAPSTPVTHATLRDGSEVTIRPIEPDDRERLARAFERLSPDARYRRFFGPMPELRPRDLDYLTRVDHHDHEALVAVAPGGDGLVGVARYIRTGPGVAEPAITVIDDWQGRGVAGALLDALVDRAREEGIHSFEAPVLATNAEAIAVLERLGDTTRERDGREVVLHIALPEGPGAGRRWASALRLHAAGTIEPARTVLEFLWPRRRGRPGAPHRNLVVVGTDGSEHAQAAVETAASLAAATGAAVDVVGADAAVVGGAAQALREHGLHVDEHVRRGDPALALTAVAADRNAALIVVGAGGRGSAARRLIGTVADVVAERAPCNVLIVRPRA